MAQLLGALVVLAGDRLVALAAQLVEPLLQAQRLGAGGERAQPYPGARLVEQLDRLAGQDRPDRKRSASSAAASSASSVIRTWWCASYRSRRQDRMPTVSTTPGSRTGTGWKRSAAAGSAASTARWPSGVVAAISGRSERARTGHSGVSACGPSTACRSATNSSRRSPQVRISSSSRATRSAASPRRSGPPSRAGTSSATIRAPRSGSGTAPLTTRWAIAATIARLPTPGSPTSSGRSRCRRESTSITCSISSSRPMTGSRSPCRARSVRSWP